MDFEVSRLLVTVTGEVFGLFNDGSTLLLQSSCEQFTHLDPNGHKHRQVTQFALRAFRKKLISVVGFRNRFTNPVYICPTLWDGETTERSSRLEFARWPRALPSKFAKLLADGGVDALSLDDATCVHLAPHGKTFDVEFPVLMDTRAEFDYTTRATRYIFKYAKINQSFSVSDYPPEWDHPLRLALQKQSQTDSDVSGELSDSSSHSASNSDLPIRLPTVTVATHSVLPEYASVTPSRSGHLDSVTRALTLIHADRAGWPADLEVSVELTKEAVYRSVKDCGVEVLILADKSLLQMTPNRKFLNHFTGKRTENPKVYSVNAVPRTYRTEDESISDYPLADIAQHACEFLDSNTSIRLLSEKDLEITLEDDESPTATVTHIPAQSERTVFSARAVECSQSAAGEFTLFADGRVRVRFTDRTLLEMCAPPSSRAELVLPDAREFVVTFERPMEFGWYISQAALFREWALKTPTQRADEETEREMEQFKISAEISKNERFLKVQRFLGGDENALTESTKTTPILTESSKPVSILDKKRQEMVQNIQQNNAEFLSSLEGK
eukprot:184663_1